MIVRELPSPNPPSLAPGPAALGEKNLLVAYAILFLTLVAGSVYSSRSMSRAMPMPGGAVMSSMAWIREPGQSWFDSASSFLIMWTVMMTAMMLPALLLTLRRYRFAAFTAHIVVAYLFVWIALGIGVYVVGASTAAAVMGSPLLSRFVPFATGLGLLCAGIVQLSAWKTWQLMRCRELPALVSSTPIRVWWKHGIRMGLDCVRCCSSFTLAMLACGLMDTRVMAVVGIAILTERFALRPKSAVRVSGLLLIAVGTFLIVRRWGAS